MEALQSSFGDAFTTLPLLIMGFIFFLGMLTSNIGLLYLFIGHLFVVPSLSYLGNEKGNPFFDDVGKPDITKILKWIVSIGIFYGINAGASQQVVGNSGLSILIFIVLAFFQGITKESYFHFFNPLTWKWNVEDEKSILGVSLSTSKPGPGCNILPHTENAYNSPSHWVNHITFFFGFIMANASAIYNQPSPTNPRTADPDADTRRKAQIDLRVTNRKSITASIMVMSLILLLILLVFRYRKTDCEGSFWTVLFPITISYLTGLAFFNLIYKSCGVRPADVLGIVQGFIAPELIDNPIVCVGTS